jgi:HSP20 family protein
MDELQRRMNRLFDEFDAPQWPTRGMRMRAGWPPVNLYDSGDALLVEALVPGLTDKEIQVSCNQGVLTLAGERKPDVPEGFSVHRRERGQVSFSRSFSLPCEVDLERTQASVKNGVLKVKLPKAEQAKPRQITVKAQ